MSEIPALPPVVNGKFQFKALQYSNYSQKPTYQTVEYPAELGPKDVLVKTKATSVNPVDVILKGLSYSWIGAKSKGFGGDFAGVVVKAGSESAYKPGDRIFGDVLSPMGQLGSFGEYIYFNESQTTMCFKIPEGVSFEEAASLPIAGCTAFQALKEHADLSGKNVLILGGGTSLGSYAIQLAKYHFGAAQVVATCSPKTSEKLKGLGADATVSYRQAESAKVNDVLEFVKTHGKFDFILDAVRDTSFYAHSTAVVHGSNKGGIYAKIGGSATMDYTNIKISGLLPSFVSIKYALRAKFCGEIATPLTIFLHDNKDFAQVMGKLVAENHFHFVIDSTLDGLTEYDQAIQKVASSAASGKVVCTF